MAADRASPFSPKIVAPGEGKTVMLFGVRFSYKVDTTDSGGTLAVLEVEIPAHTLVKPHNHTREDEFSLVLDGTVGVRVGDRELTAGPGSYLVKPRHTPHAMWNATSVPARVIEILAPAGLEAYFEELAPILAEHRPAPERQATASLTAVEQEHLRSALTKIIAQLRDGPPEVSGG